MPLVFVANVSSIDIHLCLDLACKNTSLSSSIKTSAYPSMYEPIIGSDGMVITIFFDLKENFQSSNLYLIHCENTNCSHTTTNVVDNASFVGWETAVHIASDGYPLITYMNNADRSIKVAHCVDVACQQPAVINNITSFTEKVNGLTSVIGLDGNLIFLISSAENGNLVSAHCLDLLCTQMDPYNVIGYVGNDTARTYIDILGNIHILVPGYVITCTNIQCSNVSSVTIPSINSTTVAATIDSTGYPVIVTSNMGNLLLIACGSNDCSTNVVRDIRNPVPNSNLTLSTYNVAATVGSTGYPLLSILSGSDDTDTSYIILISCANHLCTSWKN